MAYRDRGAAQRRRVSSEKLKQILVGAKPPQPQNPGYVAASSMIVEMFKITFLIGIFCTAIFQYYKNLTGILSLIV